MCRRLMHDPLLISIRHFAALLDCDARTVRRHLQTGAIPLRVHAICGMRRIAHAEAAAWIKAGTPAADGWEWPEEDDKTRSCVASA